MQITSPYDNALCAHCDHDAVVQIEGRYKPPLLLCLDHADELIQGVTVVVLEHLRQDETPGLDLAPKPPYP